MTNGAGKGGKYRNMKKLHIWIIEDDLEMQQHYKEQFKEDLHDRLPLHTLKLFVNPGYAAQSNSPVDIIFMDIAPMSCGTGTWPVALANARGLMKLYPGAVLILYSAIGCYAEEIAEELKEDATAEGVILDFIAGCGAHLFKEKVILYG